MRTPGLRDTPGRAMKGKALAAVKEKRDSHDDDDDRAGEE
jgi:hypothetical protein